MRAVFLADGKLVLKDGPRPYPGYEEALIKLTAAGVYHSDLCATLPNLLSVELFD